MGFLSRLLGREEAPAASKAAASDPICPHAVLIPHWDSTEDMGKPERATSYTCESCRETFGGEEGRRLQEHVGERIPIEEESRV
jgi:hypothetical protein